MDHFLDPDNNFIAQTSELQFCNAIHVTRKKIILHSMKQIWLWRGQIKKISPLKCERCFFFSLSLFRFELKYMHLLFAMEWIHFEGKLIEGIHSVRIRLISTWKYMFGRRNRFSYNERESKNFLFAKWILCIFLSRNLISKHDQSWFLCFKFTIISWKVFFSLQLYISKSVPQEETDPNVSWYFFLMFMNVCVCVDIYCLKIRKTENAIACMYCTQFIAQTIHNLVVFAVFHSGDFIFKITQVDHYYSS